MLSELAVTLFDLQLERFRDPVLRLLAVISEDARRLLEPPTELHGQPRIQRRQDVGFS
ncbi:hypothetical protein [Nonomuraea turkmeniaca]|uniref:hypothetical protein n=1 Tax=Nonomuraea turkmeniaca TaxID=103838 RepID=UPI001B873942|nr:hypothetical protein [Nonomuraea turkmeniaca]